MQKTVEILGNSVKLNLNKRFYSSKAINEAISAFDDVCDSRLKESDNFEVILNPKHDIDLKELALEFSNYVLGMMK